jgi:hypothetical protein
MAHNVNFPKQEDDNDDTKATDLIIWTSCDLWELYSLENEMKVMIILYRYFWCNWRKTLHTGDYYLIWFITHFHKESFCLLDYNLHLFIYKIVFILIKPVNESQKN